MPTPPTAHRATIGDEDNQTPGGSGQVSIWERKYLYLIRMVEYEWMHACAPWELDVM